ncbi:MAG: hypothetical protein AABX48_02160 [Nanoarchaeota archaeon]
MLEGLTAFHEGLIEHGLVERSKIRGQSVDQTLQRELSDMERFLGETKNLADPQVRELTETLANYAMAFYKLVNREEIGNYQQTVKKLGEFYFKMDDKFYRDLEGKPDDMKQLVGYLNEVRV